jgi:acyl carrier protein
MSTEEILEKLRTLYSEIFKEEIDFSMDTTPNDIGSWDSLNHVVLIKRIEEEFQIEIDLFEVIELRSTRDIVNVIQKRLN